MDAFYPPLILQLIRKCILPDFTVNKTQDLSEHLDFLPNQKFIDVYSFGVILLFAITAGKNMWHHTVEIP